jgi:hypothetical protein
MKSKRHLALVERVGTPESVMAELWTCAHCDKPYSTQSGLWKHMQNCKSHPRFHTTTTDVSANAELTNAIMAIHDELKELRKTQALLPNQTITNNHNNNHHIHMYLNTHCPNAMNMTQFIENMTIGFRGVFQETVLRRGPQHFAEAVCRTGPDGAADALRQSGAQPAQDVFHQGRRQRVEGRNAGGFVYQMKCIDEWQNEDEKMLLTQFFERINDKMWDTWKDMCTKDSRYQRISDRMRRVTNSDDKMSVLDDLGNALAFNNEGGTPSLHPPG